jgi:hypothetical protein
LSSWGFIFASAWKIENERYLILNLWERPSTKWECLILPRKITEENEKRNLIPAQYKIAQKYISDSMVATVR